MRIARMLVFVLAPLALPAAAQDTPVPGDVTFEVPLNLTRLAPDITRVAVWCSISTSALANPRIIRGQVAANQLSAQVEEPVANGRVVKTVRVTVAVPRGTLRADATGQSADYKCTLSGYSVGIPGRTSQGWAAGWDRFDEKQDKASFRLTPTPADITGNFTW